MSDHAATVRRFLYPGYISTPSGWKEAHDALDALLAENQRLRDALERALHRLTHVDGKVLLAIYDAQVILREALVGDTG